jgi:hypothetical protein
VPEHGLVRGESGTVVHVFEAADAYLVEFINPTDGSTRALAELTPDQLAPVGA